MQYKIQSSETAPKTKRVRQRLIHRAYSCKYYNLKQITSLFFYGVLPLVYSI